MSLENKIGNFMTMAKDVAVYVVKHPVKTVAIGAFALGISSCDRCKNVVYDDVTPPVITLNGANPYAKIIGNPYIESGATVVDDVDGVIPYDITQYNFDSDGDGYEELGEGVTKYKATDKAGNAAEKGRTVRNVVECQGLEDFLNMETIMENGEGNRMTVLEAAESLGYNLNRGTSPDESIVGNYVISGGWEDSDGYTSSWTPVEGSFSNLDGLSVDVDRGALELPNSIITGNGSFSTYYLRDEEGSPERVYVSVGEKLPSGILNIERLSIFLEEDSLGREWVKYSEVWEPIE